MDKVSVIVPVFNVDKYLKQCIESIITQTYQNIEIILVDDGSTDSSGYICDQYKEKDNRIKVIHKENGGLSSARNIGIDIADGDYIAFIDSDDSVDKQYIYALYSACKKYDCQIAQCDFLYVSEKSIKLEMNNNYNTEVLSSEMALKRACRIPDAVKYNVAWNKLYSKQLFETIRYPQNRIHEDEFTTYRLIYKANKIVVIDAYLYYYLQRKDSIMGKKFNLSRLDCMKAYEERLNYLYSKNMTNIYYEFAIMYYQSLWRVYGLVKENIDDGKVILAILEKKSDELSDIIMSNPDKTFLEKIRIIYSHLPEEKKSEYQRLYGNDAIYSRKEEFIFPYSKTPANSRVALYGAGNVGKAFYQQNIILNYAEIVLWVDNLWKSIATKGYDIRPIDELIKKKDEYDYIVLAIKNIDMAMAIRKNLIGWGIEAKRVIWHNPVPAPVIDIIYYQKNIAKFQDLITKRDNFEKKIILMNSPEHGNLGDHALAIASRNFLRDFFGEYDMLEFSGKQWDYCGTQIRQLIKPQDIIFFVGGGYMGNIWPKESMRIRSILEDFSQNIIIFLPQTFFYFNDEYADDATIWRSKKNTYFIHREKYSYEFFKNNVVTDEIRNLLYPDLVLYTKYNLSKNSRRGVSICFRADKERILTDDITKNIEEELIQRQIPYKYVNTVLNENVAINERHDKIKAILDQISDTRLLITDRLHGMLFAVITCTPCIVFDNLTHKIKGVYQWIKDIPYVKLFEGNQINFELINEAYEEECQKAENSNYEEYFFEMAENIRKWIDGGKK